MPPVLHKAQDVNVSINPDLSAPCGSKMHPRDRQGPEGVELRFEARQMRARWMRCDIHVCSDLFDGRIDFAEGCGRKTSCFGAGWTETWGEEGRKERHTAGNSQLLGLKLKMWTVGSL